MPHPGLIIGILTYIGIALGRYPGLAMDRTGIALLGAIALVAAGVISSTEAMSAVDGPTLLLLYALMVLSAQLRLGGFYTWAALRLTRLMDRPLRFLALMMLTTAFISAFVANDIVCLAFTPVLTVALLRRGLKPVPFLLGLVMACNIGSAGTLIGNPQIMLIGQAGALSFGAYSAWCIPPSLASLAAAWGLIAWTNRGKLEQPPVEPPASFERIPFDRWQSTKGGLAFGVLLVLFFTPVPREWAALCLAGLMLCSRRMHTRSILGLVDWHLLTLFFGLFIVVRGIDASGALTRAVAALSRAGGDLRQPYLLAGVAVFLSNLVSNVPASMLLIRFLDGAPVESWYTLSLATTYAGNLLTIGSLANLILIEQARRHGVVITFRDYVRTGIPVTLLSLGFLALWIRVA
ncbi:MAG: SLC13 family permease [Kiritimatiellia bacterium]|nr:SLC13 family permease [Kiritimatiellia bacterium]